MNKITPNPACLSCPIIQEMEIARNVLQNRSEKTKKRYKVLRKKNPDSKEFKLAKTSFELMRGVTVLRRALGDLLGVNFQNNSEEKMPKRFSDCLNQENLHMAINSLGQVSKTYDEFEKSLAA